MVPQWPLAFHGFHTLHIAQAKEHGDPQMSLQLYIQLAEHTEPFIAPWRRHPQ